MDCEVSLFGRDVSASVVRNEESCDLEKVVTCVSNS